MTRNRRRDLYSEHRADLAMCQWMYGEGQQDRIMRYAAMTIDRRIATQILYTR